MTERTPAHYLHGDVVIVPARIANLLRRHAGLDDLRIRARGADGEFYCVLTALHIASLQWRDSAIGTTEAPKAELGPDSNKRQWMTTGQAAAVIGVTDRAIRKAIATGHLEASNVDGRWRISVEDLAHYKAARAA
jgi:excisionase family DNA binding protein